MDAPNLSPDAWSPDDAVTTLLDRLRDRYAEHPGREALVGRIEAALPDLWTAFSEVYGDGPTSAQWVVRAVDAAVAAYDERADGLRALDRVRADRADWFQRPEHVAYTCYVDLFAGSLNGVREKIPYLKELGVTYLHLMPLLDTRDGRDDGGYAVKSYRRVDPTLGTMDDLRALAEALHKEDMLLALDFVMNHTAREHEWAQAALDGEERFRDFYLTYEDRSLPDRYEETLPEVFPDFAPGNFTFVEGLDRWVWTSFYNFQWDLDYANPDVFVQMFREMMVLANVGADVLRLDAVPFLWKEIGTNCRNLPEAHWLLRAYRALARIAAPGTLFKAEAIVAPEDIIRYLGVGGYEGKECDVAYNAALMSHLWHALASENTQLLRRALTALPDTPQTASWLNYLRCHDDIGWGLSDDDVHAVGQDPVDTRRFCANFYAGHLDGSYAEGYDFQVDEHTGEARTSGTLAALTGLQKARVEARTEAVDRALQRTLLLHNVIFFMKGMPLLYSGDEVGQLNDFSYLTDPLKADDNRWVHRSPMDWTRAERRHEEGTVEQRLFDGLRHLADARKGLDSLHARADERVLHPANDRVFVVERAYDGKRLLGVSNFSGAPQAVSLYDLPEAWAQPGYAEVLQEDDIVYTSGRILLPPYGFRWLRPASEATPGDPVATPIEIEVHTEWGEEVYLCGSVDALGNGRAEDAVGPLSADDYPVWRAEVDLPAGTYVEFRWLKKRGDEVVGWAPHPYGVKAGTDDVWPLPEKEGTAGLRPLD